MWLCIVRWVCALKGHGIRLFHSLLSSTTGLRNNGKQWILRTLNWVCSESYDVTRKFRVPTRNALWFDFIELPRYSHFTSAKCCSFCTVWELPSFALLLSLSKQKLIKYVRSVFINCPSEAWNLVCEKQYTIYLGITNWKRYFFIKSCWKLYWPISFSCSLVQAHKLSFKHLQGNLKMQTFFKFIVREGEIPLEWFPYPALKLQPH